MLPKVNIIILNWNGWQDTIECIDSVFKIDYPNYKIYLVDNDSKNDSIKQISNWLFANDSAVDYTEVFEETRVLYKGTRVVFLKNSENFGFAKGNNVAIRYANVQDSEFVLLLNNDTLVSPDFLSHLMKSFDRNPEIAAVIPQIRLHPQTDYIWNCGGTIFFGFRKYFFQQRHYSTVPTDTELKITYATGCALLFRPNDTGLLTEDYFFGEEDFEFAYRMIRRKRKMLCNTNSVIWHKVGRSVKSKEILVDKGTIFIHYLNRFIDMKHQFKNSIVWNIWKLIYLPYIFVLLKKKFTLSELFHFLKLLLKKSSLLDKVDKFEFEKARYSPDYFNQ